MNFLNYQMRIQDTWIETDKDLERCVLGLCGESGEIAEKLKKHLRGDFDRQELINIMTNEIGDVMYYLFMLCHVLNVNSNVIAEGNLAKLADRKNRNKLRGNGDNR